MTSQFGYGQQQKKSEDGFADKVSEAFEGLCGPSL
jgi:hypothetical protein